MIVKLLVAAGSASLKEVTLRRPRTVVGRKKGCKLRIRSELVSRIHCSLVVDGDQLHIKDLASSNGTFVNGLRINETVLKAGDVIQVGGVKFVVQILDGSEEPKRRVGGPAAQVADDEEVVFCEADEGAEDEGDEIIESDLLQELDDDVEFATRGEGHPPVAPAESIFAQESDEDPVLNASDFVVPDDEDEGGDYRLADSSARPKPRR